MLPVPAVMVPPVGSAVGDGAGGANAIGRAAIGGCAGGVAAKAGVQNAAMQNAATLASSREHANFTPRVLRRESMYFRRSEPIHFVDFRVADTSHQNPGFNFGGLANRFA
jgi:hypothetical protein